MWMITIEINAKKHYSAFITKAIYNGEIPLLG